MVLHKPIAVSMSEKGGGEREEVGFHTPMEPPPLDPLLILCFLHNCILDLHQSDIVWVNCLETFCLLQNTLKINNKMYTVCTIYDGNGWKTYHLGSINQFDCADS